METRSKRLTQSPVSNSTMARTIQRIEGFEGLGSSTSQFRTELSRVYLNDSTSDSSLATGRDGSGNALKMENATSYWRVPFSTTGEVIAGFAWKWSPVLRLGDSPRPKWIVWYPGGIWAGWFPPKPHQKMVLQGFPQFRENWERSPWPPCTFPIGPLWAYRGLFPCLGSVAFHGGFRGFHGLPC